MESMDNGNLQAPQAAPKPKWWWSTKFLIFALLSVGPLALPLLWLNPKYSTTQKLLWTVVTAGISYWLWITSVSVFQQFMQQARDLGLIQ